MFYVSAPNDFTSAFNFTPKENRGENTYLVSFHWDYKISEPWLVNNIAYYGTSTSDEYTQYAIQKLILELVNPSYEVIVKDNFGNIIDLSHEEEVVLRNVDKYNSKDPLSKNTYTVDVFDSLEIEGNYIDYYEPVNAFFYASDKGMKSEVFNTVGKKNLQFKNRIFIEHDRIIPNGYQYMPFSINLEVEGNSLVFNTDYTYGGLSLNVYENDLLIDNIYLSEYNKVYYYKSGKNLKFVDVTKNSSYELIEDVYVENESIELNIKRNTKNMLIKVLSYYKSYDYKVNEVKNENVSIYDEDFNLIDSCINKTTCEFLLPLSTYYIRDLDTNYIVKEKIIRDRTIYLNEYLIDGFISSDEILIDNTTKKGDLYYLDEPIKADVIVIDNVTYDLRDYNNYVFINNEGLFYQIIKKDEVIKEEIPKEVEEIPKEEEVIEISVPDTLNTLPLHIYKRNEEDYTCYIINACSGL